MSQIASKVRTPDAAIATVGGMVMRPILKHNLDTAVQWRVAPGGRGSPICSTVGAGERDGEGAAESMGVTVGGNPSVEPFGVNRSVDLCLGF